MFDILVSETAKIELQEKKIREVTILLERIVQLTGQVTEKTGYTEEHEDVKEQMKQFSQEEPIPEKKPPKRKMPRVRQHWLFVK